MKRAMLMVVGALIAVVPFAWGMLGNSTLTRPVPVQIPSQAQVLPAGGQPTAEDRVPEPAAVLPAETVSAAPVPTGQPTTSDRSGSGRASGSERRGGDDGSDDRRGRGRGRGGDDDRSGSGHGGRDDRSKDDRSGSGHGGDDD